MLKLAKIDSIQKKINQYTYASTDSIGKGFSSQVFKGKNQQTDEQVAIKMIDMKFIKGEVHKNLLANQIQILKLLRSLPNILEFYDVFTMKNNTCIITQLCEGGDLSKLLKTNKVLSQNEALNILKQIINGYKGIYRFGIIHRDLKPANIFFVNGKVKIADFGFAIKQSNIKKESSYNVGSPVYMPLEALNENMYSFKSDVWAIGVIFYEMLTGKTPWRAKTQSDLKRQIKNNHIKTLIPSHLSLLTAEFLKRTLQPNPVLRMTPQQLQRYFIKNQTPNCGSYEDSSIKEKTDSNVNANNLFLTQKRQTNFRTRAISNEKDDRLPKNDTVYGKYPLNFQVTGMDRRKVFLKDICDNGYTYENLGRTTATIGKSTETTFNILDIKKTLEQLISQIHFCRFLFKLIDRLNKSFNLDINKRIRIKMTSIIFEKLKQTSMLKLLDLKSRDQFKKTPEYLKIMGIVTQYEQKYRQSLDIFINDINDFNQSQDLSDLLVKEIQTLHMFIESIANPEEVTEEVILLDYMITCKQLLNILETSNLADFHSKAKMQAIVNGKPTKNITAEHIKAIKDKLKFMKIIY